MQLGPECRKILVFIFEFEIDKIIFEEQLRSHFRSFKIIIELLKIWMKNQYFSFFK